MAGEVPAASTAEADPAQAAQAGAGAQPSGEDLQRLLDEARSKADEHWDKFVRASAELDNAHSLELGLAAAVDPQAGLTKLREGMELTVKLFGDVLQKFGVEAVDPAGSPFDPNLHQALSTQPRDDVPANTVITVVQKGYTLNGRLVRPALVMVSRPAGQQGIDEKA